MFSYIARKEDLRKIQEYRDEKMKQTIAKGKLRKEGKVPQTEPKLRRLESPGTLALKRNQMQNLRKLQDKKIEEAALKSKNKSAIPQPVSRPVSSKSLVIDEGQLKRIAENRAAKLEKAKEIGKLKKLGLPLPVKQVKIPESKFVVENKQKLEEIKAQQSEIAKRLKTDLWLELWFARTQYHDHLVHDAEREGLNEYELKEHVEYLHLEYLAKKEHLLREYAAQLSMSYSS